ncbi:MAG: hypothetical protein ACO1NU_01870 [Arcticibacter sp.]
MKYFFCSILLAGLMSCQQPSSNKDAAGQSKEAKIDSSILISCDGIGEIKTNISYADLEQKVGAKALTAHENTIYGRFTTIWENTPKAINVYWKEKTAPFKTVDYLEVVDPASVYRTADSLQIGMGLRDLVRKNENMPLTFRNFYATEKSGLITSFNNGAIARNNPCLAGVLEWSSQENVYKDQYEAFKKQEFVESYEKILDRIEVNLSAIRILNKQ